MDEFNNAIKLTQVSAGFEDKKIINNLSLDIKKKEFVIITGSNGSGKSTLVKAILKLVPLKHGKIEIFGKLASTSRIAKYIGYLPQYSSIERDFPITVSELIGLACPKQDKCDINVAGHLEYLNSKHLAKRQIEDLSGGEFQRVLIARCLINDPQIIILDEPANNLDHKTQQKLIQLLLDLNKKGKTIIMITHDIHISEEIKNARVIEMEDGKIK